MIVNKRTFPTIFFTSLIAATVLFLGNAEAATKAQVKRIVIEEAQRNGTVPPSLALAVAKVESGFDERALSSVGARGVMQIMPKTAMGEFNVSAGRLWDPRLNIQLGIAYLERLYRQYGGRWDLALSHYNGGTLKGGGRYARPHSYTRRYVSSVLGWSRRYERDATTVALASAAADKNGSYGDNYWMFDTPDVDKDWRHYLKVADYWLKPAGARAATEPETTRAYWDEEDGGDWMPVDGEAVRPSDRLKAKVNTLRRKFRERLQRNETPWTPIRDGRRPRFS